MDGNIGDKKNLRFKRKNMKDLKLIHLTLNLYLTQTSG